MRVEKRGFLLFSLIGFLFFFCVAAERKLAACGNIVWSAGQTAGLLAFGALAGVAAGCLLYVLAVKVSGIAGRRASERGALPRKFSPGAVFAFSWLAMFLAWLPAYLAYYPAICSYDMTIQLAQITERSYNDHHPIIHTLLIEGFLRLGNSLGSATSGMGMYALVQMLSLSAALAAGVGAVYSWGAGKGWLIFLILYGCLFPFHMYLGISVTKDTFFSAFFFLMLLSLWGLLRRDENRVRPGWRDGVYVCLGVLVVLFRTNGKFALFVLLGFLVLSCIGKSRRKLFLRLSAATALSAAIGMLLLQALFGLTQASQGDRREMLCLPIQQLARVMIYHGGVGVREEDDASMRQEDRALIQDFILDEAYREYRGEIADPVKRHVNTYVARYRAKEFLSAYLRLFAGYPGDYINAALAVNAGYLSPFDTTHALVNVNGRDRGLGYIQTRWVEGELNPQGIDKESKWVWLYEKLEDFADGNVYLRIPVLKYVMVPGSYLWFWALFAAWTALRRRYRMLLPFALVFGFYGTLLLGPTVQLRYLYPVMIALPCLLAAASCGSRE